MHDNMVKTEFYKNTESGIKLYKTYSDSNLYIRKLGTTEEYSTAIDIEGHTFTYEETDRIIPQDEEGGEI